MRILDRRSPKGEEARTGYILLGMKGFEPRAAEMVANETQPCRIAIFPSVEHFRHISRVNVAKGYQNGSYLQYFTLIAGFYAVELMTPGLAVTCNTCYLEKA